MSLCQFDTEHINIGLEEGILEVIKRNSLKSIIDSLEEYETVLFLSNKETFKSNKNVVTIKSHFDFGYAAGLEFSALFIDRSFSELYNIKLLEFLLTRVRGEGCEKFPEKFYFVSDWDDYNNYTFYGEVKL